MERDYDLERLYMEIYCRGNLINESFDPEEYHERLDKIKYRMLRSFLDNPKGKWRLIKVPASRVKKIWLEFGKRNTITDLNGLDKIAESLLDGICSLRVASQLYGHTDDGLGYTEMFEDVFDWDEEETRKNVNEDDLYEFLTVVTGKNQTEDFLSDYGLRPLENLVPRIADESDPIKRLYAIDRAFNVIHQRSDLAAFFIDGGSKTMLEIYNQGGYSSGD